MRTPHRPNDQEVEQQRARGNDLDRLFAICHIPVEIYAAAPTPARAGRGAGKGPAGSRGALRRPWVGGDDPGEHGTWDRRRG